MKKNYLFPLLAGLVLALSSCDTGKNLNKTTVENVDLTRYMGKWYEIARFDFSFEKGLVGTTAEYTLKSDGTVAVVNRGFEKTLDGKPTVAEGKARGQRTVPDRDQGGHHRGGESFPGHSGAVGVSRRHHQLPAADVPDAGGLAGTGGGDHHRR